VTLLPPLAERMRERCWHVLHRLVFARMGFGSPVSRSVWERQYRGGEWDFLYSEDERAHYDAIVELVAAHAPPHPRILDVGCGPGRLLQLLAPLRFARYTGVDLSVEAVRRAKSLGSPDASFEVADFQQWDPGGPYDAIVFNESLYYALRPRESARRYARALAGNGCLIISAVEYGDMAAMWRRLESGFEVVGARSVVNAKGTRWTIKALRAETSR
jgi:SAM-dependent methyltransferase